MQVDPAYFNSVAPPNFPTGSNGTPTAAEYVTQAALMLGYLALLCRNPVGADLSEAQRIYNEYVSTYKQYLDQDKTIGPMVEAAYASLVDGTGTVTQQTASIFLGNYTTTDPTKSPPYLILKNWLQAGQFTFNSSTTDPDTYFAFSMFMTSLGVTDPSLNLQGELDKFMGEGVGSGAPFPCYWLTQQFLFAYFAANGSKMDINLQDLFVLLPQVSPTTPEYDKFYSSFISDWQQWQKNPPSDPQEALQLIIDNWQFTIPN